MEFPDFNAIRRAARKMRPTRQHEPVVWECMLGTLYARNAAGEVRYFDYDYAAAAAWVGDAEDVRVARAPYERVFGGPSGGWIRQGQLVWWARRIQPQEDGR